MQAIFQTPRLIVRNFLPDEQDLYLNMFTDDRVTQYLPKRTTDERLDIFKKMIDDAGSLLNNWAVFTLSDNEQIGMILLRPYTDAPEKTEVGYAMLHRFWGQGLGTEMVTAAVAYAFEKTETNEVVAVTVLENIGSQKVLEKAGMQRQDNIFRDGIELAYFKIHRPVINRETKSVL
jgi:ribosomal-protein-alanine N-acetyltransferase